MRCEVCGAWVEEVTPEDKQLACYVCDECIRLAEEANQTPDDTIH